MGFRQVLTFNCAIVGESIIALCNRFWKVPSPYSSLDLLRLKLLDLILSLLYNLSIFFS